jgi:hypothetical protein
MLVALGSDHAGYVLTVVEVEESGNPGPMTTS